MTDQGKPEPNPVDLARETVEASLRRVARKAFNAGYRAAKPNARDKAVAVAYVTWMNGASDEGSR